MPPLLTFVARRSDGLILVSSFANSTENLDLEKKQAKEILRNINSNGRATSKMKIDTSTNKTFYYLIHGEICYLTLTESAYPKRLAFLYLEEINECFIEYMIKSHGNDNYISVISTTGRPFALISAEPLIQRKQREFVDPKSTANNNKLQNDLAEIHTILSQNISDVLDRGEKLENVSQISSNLMSESKKFKWGTKKLGWKAKVNTYAPIAAMGLFILVVLYLKFF